MTKKDYIIIAKKLNSIYHDEIIYEALDVAKDLFTRIVDSMIEVMAKDNNRFDAMKFKKEVYK